MFKLVAVLASLLSVSAFTPARVASRATSLKMSFEDELGALPPVGFWDPLGLSADGDREKFDRRREVEMKHGRVAMLAVVGYVFQEYLRFPGAIDLDGTTFGKRDLKSLKSFDFTCRIHPQRYCCHWRCSFLRLAADHRLYRLLGAHRLGG